MRQVRREVAPRLVERALEDLARPRPGLADDERSRHELGERRPPAATLCPRMTGPDHDDEHVPHDRPAAQPSPHRGALDEAEVRAAGQDELHDVVGVAHDELDVRPVRTMGDLGEPAWCEVLRDRHARCQAHARCGSVPQRGDTPLEAVRRAQHLLRPRGGCAPRVGEVRPRVPRARSSRPRRRSSRFMLADALGCESPRARAAPLIEPCASAATRTSSAARGALDRRGEAAASWAPCGEEAIV